MANLKDSVNSFQTGDLVFTRFPPTTRQPIHVTLYLGPREGMGRSYVHAGKEYLEIAHVDTYEADKGAGGYLHAVPTDPEIRRRTAEIAVAFASTVRRTPYGDYPSSQDFQRMKVQVASPHASRFTGMIRTESFAAIPFEMPSLIRLLKWTCRYLNEEPLSVNRGITCAAFVSICHQVARMHMFLEDVGVAYNTAAILQTKRKLDALVETKDALRKDLEKVAEDPLKGGKPIFRDQAYRENSNRNLTEEGRVALKRLGKAVDYRELPAQTKSPRLRKKLSDLERQWIAIQTQWLGIHESQTQLLEDILGRPFFFDAKYVSSIVLSRRVQEIGWKTTEYKKYD